MSDNKPLQVLVQGLGSADDLPGIEAIPSDVDLHFANDDEALAKGIESAEVLLGWNFAAGSLQSVWPQARALRWIQWGGAGVDAVLFPELRQSDVVLTNARGIFDRAMAEYALGLIIALAKGFPRNWKAQGEKQWDWRFTPLMHGRKALVVGVGSIGREIGRVLRSFGLEVEGVGRAHRATDDIFNVVHAADQLHAALATAEYVVVIVPATPQTAQMFGADEFAAMRNDASFINLARGSVVDEPALIRALETGVISSAALDVFATEPLPSDSPLWHMDNVIVSPHMSGDHTGAPADLVALFADNLARYREGRPLRNLVDKGLGFADPAGAGNSV